MHLKLVRNLKIDDNAFELLLEVDTEFLDIYRSETGDYEDPLDREEFSKWLNNTIGYGIDGENWKYED